MEERLKEILNYARQNKIPVLLDDSADFLSKLVSAAAPERILEIGTAIGYSGSLMLLNSKKAVLTTIEKQESEAKIASKNFKLLNLTSRVTQITGDAAEVLPSLFGEFDFIFLDGPKAQYVKYLPQLKRLLSPGGMLVSDNVFFRGYVESEDFPKKKKSIVLGLRKYIEVLKADDELETEFYHIGDGISVSRKKLQT